MTFHINAVSTLPSSNWFDKKRHKLSVLENDSDFLRFVKDF